MKGRWYDRIEISIFLCTPVTRGEQCEPGQGVTQAQKDAIRTTLETNPEVAPGGVYFESKQEAFEEFQKAYEGNPIQDSLTVDEMQESFRVKLKNPEEYEGVVSSVVGLKGRADRPGSPAVPRPVLQLAEPAAVGHDHRLGAAARSRPPCRSATRSGWPPSPAGERSASCAWSERAISISRCRSCSKP